MKYELINSKEKWQLLLSLFYETDIYFDYDYHNLYSTNDEEIIEAFYYTDEINHFFFPYIKKKIPDTNEWWDFETVYGYTGPLSTSENSNFISNAWGKLKTTFSDIGIVCGLIRYHPFIENVNIAQAEFIENINIRPTVYVDLERPYEEIRGSYSSSCKRAINKASLCSLRLEVSWSEKSYNYFYDEYLKHMKYLGAENFYLFPQEYFVSLRRLGKEKSKIFFAEYNNKIIAAIIILYGQQNSHYHLGWSLSQGRELRSNNFLFNEAITALLESRHKKFNLGGGVSNSLNDSLLKFKKGFSENTKDFYIGKVMICGNKYQILCDKWSKSSKINAQEKNDDLFLKYRYKNK